MRSSPILAAGPVQQKVPYQTLKPDPGRGTQGADFLGLQCSGF